MMHDDIVDKIKYEIKDLSIEVQSMSVRMQDKDAEFYTQYRSRFLKAIESIAEKKYILEALSFYRNESD